MATRSRDFVGVAEGIKSHEISTKGRIEQLKGRISELSSQKSSLNGTISYLESAIAAAYEDTDEDGDPDYALIASLESQKASAENELSGVEQDLDTTGGELAHSESELQGVLENKAQTLFEIQERARKTSSNISLACGMYGAYAGVGSSLQSSMQTSLSALSQAAGILGGSVDCGGSGTSGGSSGGSHGSGTGAHTQSGLSTSPLAAFSGGDTGSSMSSSAPSLSQFSSSQTDHSTPGTLPNFHSGQSTINAQKPLNFNSSQESGNYTQSSFSDNADNSEEGLEGAWFSSRQKSANADSNYSNSSPNQGTKSYFEEKRSKFISDLHYDVSGSFDPKKTTSSSSTSSTSSAPDKGQREIGEELEHGFSVGSVFMRKKATNGSVSTPSSQSVTPTGRGNERKEFVQRIKVNVSPFIIHNNSSSSGSSDDPQIGQKELDRPKKNQTDYERSVLSAFGLTHYVDTESTTSSHSSDSSTIKNQILSSKPVQPSAKNQLLKQPRSLSSTAQSWKKSNDGSFTYNSPIETCDKLDCKQGKVENYLGTCGLVSCENILRMAGIPINESDVVKFASRTHVENSNAPVNNQTLCVSNSSPYANGGTGAKSRQKILEHYGIPSYTAKQSVDTIAKAVISGHGVIISVHAGMLYQKRRVLNDLHAITVLSVKTDTDGNVIGFYVCDSNSEAMGKKGAMYYSIEEISDSLSDRECNITSTIIR